MMIRPFVCQGLWRAGGKCERRHPCIASGMPTGTKGIVVLACTCLLMSIGHVLADEFVAYSLRVARERIEAAGETDWRKVEPEVFTLGGITRVRGAVYDRDHDDLILVGHRDRTRPILTIDELSVALRARFALGQWPLVRVSQFLADRLP